MAYDDEGMLWIDGGGLWGCIRTSDDGKAGQKVPVQVRGCQGYGGIEVLPGGKGL